MNTITNRILSPTAINTYLFCPQKFYFRYIQKLRSKPSIHLVRGQIVHQTIHHFHRKSAENTQRSPPQVEKEILALFNQEWEQAQATIESLPLTQPETDSYRKQSEEMLRNFAHWHDKNRRPPASSETKIFSWNLRLMGIIDAIHLQNNRVFLVDYKTSKHPTITEEIHRQAALYALLYEDQHGVSPAEIRIHFLIQPGDPTSIPVDQELLAHARNMLQYVNKKTAGNDKEDYPCTCGGLCKKDFL